MQVTCPAWQAILTFPFGEMANQVRCPSCQGIFVVSAESATSMHVKSGLPPVSSALLEPNISHLQENLPDDLAQGAIDRSTNHETASVRVRRAGRLLMLAAAADMLVVLVNLILANYGHLLGSGRAVLRNPDTILTTEFVTGMLCGLSIYGPLMLLSYIGAARLTQFNGLVWTIVGLIVNFTMALVLLVGLVLNITHGLQPQRDGSIDYKPFITIVLNGLAIGLNLFAGFVAIAALATPAVRTAYERKARISRTSTS